MNDSGRWNQAGCHPKQTECKRNLPMTCLKGITISEGLASDTESYHMIISWLISDCTELCYHLLLLNLLHWDFKRPWSRLITHKTLRLPGFHLSCSLRKMAGPNMKDCRVPQRVRTSLSRVDQLQHLLSWGWDSIKATREGRACPRWRRSLNWADENVFISFLAFSPALILCLCNRGDDSRSGKCLDKIVIP